ncbi:MAG: hypothetical protein R3C15_11020 [Thermoleophilia bacterium]
MTVLAMLARALDESGRAAERRGVRGWLDQLRAGRMQKTLAVATAIAAPPLAFEIYLEHSRGRSATSGCGRRSSSRRP